jgi:hypothetical protein
MKKCSICVHENRPQIDLAIATGLNKRSIAARFKVSPDAVWRHQQNHLSPEIRAALALKLVRKEGDVRAVLLEEGSGAIEALRAVRGPLFSRFLCAVDVGDDRAAAALSGRLHEGLALSAKLSGELMPHANINIGSVVLHPDYLKLRAELLRILARYPEARQEVAAAFRQFGEAAVAEMGRSIPRAAAPMIEGAVTEVSDAA